MNANSRQLNSALNIVKGFIAVMNYSDAQFVDYMDKNDLWSVLDDKNLVFSPWMEPEHYLNILGKGLSDSEKKEALSRLECI